MPIVKKEESIDQKPSIQVETELQNKVKNEIEEEAVAKTEVKPLINIKIELKKEDDCSLNAQPVPKTERTEGESETKPKFIKNEGVSASRQIDVKLDCNKLMKAEVKLAKIERGKEADQKPDIQGSAELENEIKPLKIESDVMKVEPKKKLVAKKEKESQDSMQQSEL